MSWPAPSDALGLLQTGSRQSPGKIGINPQEYLGLHGTKQRSFDNPRRAAAPKRASVIPGLDDLIEQYGVPEGVLLPDEEDEESLEPEDDRQRVQGGSSPTGPASFKKKHAATMNEIPLNSRISVNKLNLR